MIEREPKVSDSKRARVVEALRNDLDAGRWRPGQQLPAEPVLAERFSVNRHTVRAALEVLAADGLVTSVRRQGWYAQPDERVEFHFLAVDDNRQVAKSDVWNTWVAALGRSGWSDLKVSRAVAPATVADLLELAEGEECMVRARVRFAGDEPWMISTAYWPCWLTDGDPLMSREGTGNDVDMQDPSPLKWAAQHGYPERMSLHEFDARHPTDAEASVLGIGTSAPVLLTYTTSRAETGRPFRCTADVFPRHRFRLMAEHKRTAP
jgi:GntR family transcriptional regulator